MRALSMAHCIGRPEQPVAVFRLVTKGTMEERVHQLVDKKKGSELVFKSSVRWGYLRFAAPAPWHLRCCRVCAMVASCFAGAPDLLQHLMADSPCLLWGQTPLTAELPWTRFRGTCHAKMLRKRRPQCVRQVKRCLLLFQYSSVAFVWCPCLYLLVPASARCDRQSCPKPRRLSANAIKPDCFVLLPNNPTEGQVSPNNSTDGQVSPNNPTNGQVSLRAYKAWQVLLTFLDSPQGETA